MTPAKFETIARTDLDEQIVVRIRGEILSGAYAPGDLLPPERELATQFDVNRTTVREALTRLEHLGLVERRQGVGCRVLDHRHTASVDLLPYLLEGMGEAGFDLEAVRSLVEFGEVYWTFVARKAAEEATGQDIDRLLADLDATERSIAGADEREAAVRVERFYEDIVTATHSIVLELLRNTFMKILGLRGDDRGSIFTELAARAIADDTGRDAIRDVQTAIAAHDADAAEQAMRRAYRDFELIIVQRGSPQGERQ